jgi:O-antigen/teichoic acid export membrane protein
MRLQVIYNIADKIIKLGAIFVVSVVAARVFSRDDYGVFVYVNVILAIAASIYSSGIDTSYAG